MKRDSRVLGIFCLVAFLIVAAQSTPTVTSHPAGLRDGEVVGSGFGTKEGFVWIRPVAKITPKTEAQGVNEENRAILYSQMEFSNQVGPLTISRWSDTRIAVKIPSDLAAGMVETINQRRNMTLDISDFDFLWQVDAGGKSSPWK